jgi:pimeloyl-ACP methyl ester carboxylesterase
MEASLPVTETESQTRDAAAFFQPAPEKPRLAYLARPAKPQNALPGLFWLSGFRSDMRGSKAGFIAELAASQGRACLRFDYSGHGESQGDFADGAIGVWAAEAVAAFRALTRGPQIVIGSSMGGWIALLLARALAAVGETDRLAGMVLIAPAVDFTEDLLWPQLPEPIRREIEQQGAWLRPADAHGPAYAMTRRLFEDGRANLLFGGEIRTFCPVTIIQGMADPDVPWRQAMKLVEHLAADPTILTLIKDGEHRLSRPGDLSILQKAIEQIDAGAGPSTAR